jgi:hypothetical protein
MLLGLLGLFGLRKRLRKCNIQHCICEVNRGRRSSEGIDRPRAGAGKFRSRQCEGERIGQPARQVRQGGPEGLSFRCGQLLEHRLNVLGFNPSATNVLQCRQRLPRQTTGQQEHLVRGVLEAHVEFADAQGSGSAVRLEAQLRGHLRVQAETPNRFSAIQLQDQATQFSESVRQGRRIGQDHATETGGSRFGVMRPERSGRSDRRGTGVKASDNGIT